MTQNNIYDTANQLERELREMPAYKELQASLKAIQANEESKKLFDEFRTLSMTLQEKQMQGEEPSEEDLAGLQAMSVKVSTDENINRLMMSEQQVGQVINDINEIVTKPINELYQA